MSIFTHIKQAMIGSNKFDLSHDLKLTFSMGEIIPTTVMEVVPGDKVKINVNNFLRFQPLIAPVMHKVEVKTDYFFVPNRILWDGFEKWLSGDADPSVLAPYINMLDGIDTGSVGDYLGIPTTIVNTALQANALPIAAYAKIYDDYYRDENLQVEVKPLIIAGDNTGPLSAIAEAVPLKRAWEHDYFTSALPFAQKGDAVTLPLTSNQNIDVKLKTATPSPNQQTRATDDLALIQVSEALGSSVSGTLFKLGSGSEPVVIDPNGTLEVDINEEAVEINDLRLAIRVQEWLEKNARGGTRYIELIKSHFGVSSSDQRMNRPEYIGGDRQNMVISEVLSTTQTQEFDSNTITNPVGQMAGHGISVGGGKSFSYKAKEHGFIMGIISVQPKTAYSQGLSKMWSRPDKHDYYWPTFAHLGEQAILSQEVFAESTLTADLVATFGYIPRYSEYKFLNSRVAGSMRDTLAFWTFARDFATKPELNSDFIECDPTNDPFAVTTGNKVIAHIFNNISAIRKMPKYGTPTL